MDKLFYERSSFKKREDAWSHIEAHWAESNPQVARRLNWERVKSEYVAAFYWEGRWHLLRELIDYSERKPTPPGAREVIDNCPTCGKPGLIGKEDYLVKGAYVHIMGVKDNRKEIPVIQHFITRDPRGMADVSNI